MYGESPATQPGDTCLRQKLRAPLSPHAARRGRFCFPPRQPSGLPLRGKRLRETRVARAWRNAAGGTQGDGVCVSPRPLARHLPVPRLPRHLSPWVLHHLRVCLPSTTCVSVRPPGSLSLHTRERAQRPREPESTRQSGRLPRRLRGPWQLWNETLVDCSGNNRYCRGGIAVFREAHVKRACWPKSVSRKFLLCFCFVLFLLQKLISVFPLSWDDTVWQRHSESVEGGPRGEQR